ncbi:MAG: endopolygalacturonase, partial [Burkholderiales bacterium]|nr:endopolygalacturonase [Burkholderiales bacterium]
MNKQHRLPRTPDGPRRDFLKLASSASLAALPPRGVARSSDPWRRAQAIIDSFAEPVAFRDQDFLITAFGAQACRVQSATAWISFSEEATVDTPAPGSKDCHAAIKAAIASCHAAGGGRVVIPAGDWYVAGHIVLISNVHVHLKAGAHVYFSQNPADYAKTGDFDCGKNGKLTLVRWEGNDLLNYSPMVYAYGQTNIALTGEDWTSILDGQAGLRFSDGPDCWWSWKGREHSEHGVD